MNMLDSLGGRKFVGLVFISLVGIALEVNHSGGLNIEVAGFLATMYGMFIGANAYLTKNLMGAQVPPIDVTPVELTADEPAEPEPEAPTATPAATFAPNQLANLEQAQVLQMQHMQGLQQRVDNLQKTMVAMMKLQEPHGN
jgi:hypothetical protein